MVRAAIAQLILFVVLITASLGVVGMALTQTQLYSQAVDDETDRTVADVDAEVVIIDDSAAWSVYDDDAETVTLHVKNVGGGTLEPDALDVLVDGQFVENTSATVLDGDHWRPGSVVRLVLPWELDPGAHRAVVRIHGAQDLLRFEHRLAFWHDPSGEPGTSDCDAESCTVDANETDTLTLTMGTDPVVTDETVEYWSTNETVATVSPTSGVTDGAGENSTTLSLESDGTTEVWLDTGWDDDVIEITVVNASNS